jgi:RNA polymerase sigma-70 factor (ECF subfamily)
LVAQFENLEALIGRARSATGPERGALLDSYRGYLSLLCRIQINRLLQGKVSASDVVQETFLEAHRDFGGFRGSSEPELTSWLRRILATNLANAHRHFLGVKARDARLERRLAEELDHSSAALTLGMAAQQSSPSAGLMQREQAVLVADALQELPEDYREVLVQRHIEGRSFTQIAESMQRSLDSVQKLWTRGLDKLRRQLKSAGGKGE